MNHRLTQVVGSVLVVAGLSLFAITLLNTDEADVAAPEATSMANALPTATPPPLPASVSPIVSFKVSKISIDAPVVVLGVDDDGTMQAPSTPVDVGWYGFSAYPGQPGNAVFAGHLDYARYGAAVFYDLKQLATGDEIEVHLEDATVYTYRVVSSRTFSSSDAPIEEIIGHTSSEVITLITCDGVFNTRSGEYDKRLVVRAERVQAAVASQPESEAGPTST